MLSCTLIPKTTKKTEILAPNPSYYFVCVGDIHRVFYTIGPILIFPTSCTISFVVCIFTFHRSRNIRMLTCSLIPKTTKKTEILAPYPSYYSIWVGDIHRVFYTIGPIPAFPPPIICLILVLFIRLGQQPIYTSLPDFLHHIICLIYMYLSQVMKYQNIESFFNT